MQKELQGVSELKVLCADLKELVQVVSAQTNSSTAAPRPSEAPPGDRGLNTSTGSTAAAVTAPVNHHTEALQQQLVAPADGAANNAQNNNVDTADVEQESDAEEASDSIAGEPVDMVENLTLLTAAASATPRRLQVPYADVVRRKSSSPPAVDNNAYSNLLSKMRVSVNGVTDSDSEGYEPVQRQRQRKEKRHSSAFVFGSRPSPHTRPADQGRRRQGKGPS